MKLWQVENDKGDLFYYDAECYGMSYRYEVDKDSVFDEYGNLVDLSHEANEEDHSSFHKLMEGLIEELYEYRKTLAEANK